ncbi:FTR1 family iron permease [Saccharococcus caldoxylosilyticus]|uniref:Putative ferrous iron uptake protein n=1 Tax=Parageobacillus caldoxylosilyticus NBRC 107762 TaxID=1220594 RepID=A0A023DIL1_9BACL|nr:FTR1 family protein [Parageobacillus caldoxylosilyticus]MBB3853983.1 high-affinity iron transporter [Parageobacillus caldoxylosilyticus]GAJ40826.1 putative ferrous iron uptake protein [Parageobacillus caldoxylosilyticus NBRC 107762]
MAAFLMLFREAFEASMLCSILATYLILIGQRDRIRNVWTGIFAAIIASLIAGVAIYSTVQNYEGTSLELQIEGISYLLAFGMLTYMATSMQKNENLKEGLESRIDSAIKTGSKFAIAGFTFLAVFREGLEMVVFMIPLTSITNPVLNIVLGVLGIIAGSVTGYLIYALGKKINVKYFFNLSTFLLVIFAAGFLVSGIGEFQQLGWLPFGNETLWDTSSILSSDSAAGHLLHALVGYTDKPTSLQVIGYVVYLALIGILAIARKRS